MENEKKPSEIYQDAVAWAGGLKYPEDRDVLESHMEEFLDDYSFTLAEALRREAADWDSVPEREAALKFAADIIDPHVPASSYWQLEEARKHL